LAAGLEVLDDGLNNGGQTLDGLDFHRFNGAVEVALLVEEIHFHRDVRLAVDGNGEIAELNGIGFLRDVLDDELQFIFLPIRRQLDVL
jgi:hypothetical protein